MSNADIYQSVTERILDCLSKGVVPWRKPWAVAAPRNLSSGHVYRGINTILLSCTAFSSPYWITAHQAKQLRGNIKRGERGTPIVFWKVYEDEKRNGEIDKRFVLRRFFVFNVEQTERLHVPTLQAPKAFDPLEDCEKIVTSYENAPLVEHGGGQACYFPSQDRILMPPKPAFTSSEEYYSTLFHEFIHSTGAAKRLARKGVTDPTSFAGHDYSYEELIAECGSAFLCSHAGIAPATLHNSASYIGHWSRALKNDPTWLVRAASAAAKASDFILGKQWKGAEDTEEERSAEAA